MHVVEKMDEKREKESKCTKGKLQKAARQRQRAVRVQLANVEEGVVGGRAGEGNG